MRPIHRADLDNAEMMAVHIGQRQQSQERIVNYQDRQVAQKYIQGTNPNGAHDQSFLFDGVPLDILRRKRASVIEKPGAFYNPNTIDIR